MASLQRACCGTHLQHLHNRLQKCWDTWPLFANFWISQSQVKHPPSFLHNIGQTRNDHNAGEWSTLIKGGDKFGKLRIFFSFRAKFTKKIPNFWKVSQQFCNRYTTTAMKISVPNSSHLLSFFQCIQILLHVCVLGTKEQGRIILETMIWVLYPKDQGCLAFRADLHSLSCWSTWNSKHTRRCNDCVFIPFTPKLKKYILPTF